MSNKKLFAGAIFKRSSGTRKRVSSGSKPCCVEVAEVNQLIGVRDSKNPKGPILVFNPDEWKFFLEGVKNGEFD